MKEVILKLQEYENLLKDIQVYFYKSVECRVQTQNEHVGWINKINDVLFKKPVNKHNSAKCESCGAELPKECYWCRLPTNIEGFQAHLRSQ
jgi:hypothetical protein